MFARPVARAQTKSATSSPHRHAAQSSIFATRRSDPSTVSRGAARVPWKFCDIATHPEVKCADATGGTPTGPAAEIRGSTQREANEAEAERAARSVAAFPAPRADEKPRPLPRYFSAAPVSAGRELPDTSRRTLEHAFARTPTPGIFARVWPSTRMPRMSSLRTSEWRVSGHRNARAGTVGGCRRRVWSSLLSSPRAGRQGEVARAYGVSQGWVSRLVARYRAEGEAAFEPRSRRPKTSPSAISPDTAAELIVRLRKELAGQGLDAGPHTIAWHLQHHHQVQVSPATISRYLARAGLVTPEPAKRPRSSYLRFEAEQPNECWQSDFTHYPLADGTGTEILTWLDDHSRLRPVGHRPPPGHRPDRAGRLPRRRRRPRAPRPRP